MTSEALPAGAFVPHRAPLLLVDEVLAHDACSITTRSTVHDQPPFGDGAGGVPAYLGLELMAQSVAALSGIRRSGRGLAPIVGLLVGTRRYRASVPRFLDGTALTVHAVEKLADYVDMNVFVCRITGEDGRLLAEADVKAYQPDNIQAYLDANP